MRISRPCYDKIWRCPGWAGGGMRYARVDRCDDGRLPGDLFDRRLWRWRCNRCTTCGVLALPYMIRYVDPGWYTSRLRFRRSLRRLARQHRGR